MEPWFSIEGNSATGSVGRHFPLSFWTGATSMECVEVRVPAKHKHLVMYDTVQYTGLSLPPTKTVLPKCSSSKAFAQDLACVLGTVKSLHKKHFP